MLHAHVRGDQDQHVLDPVRYRLLLDAMAAEAPDMLVQVTTEAVGRYTQQQQADCVTVLQPAMISMAVREMAGEGTSPDLTKRFYHECHARHTHVQHIVYDAVDVENLFALHRNGIIPGDTICALYVLGRYTTGRDSTPADIDPFLEMADRYVAQVTQFDWFVCAFGRHEHQCALRAIELGGHARVGFENNLLRPDGSVADSNAEQVAALKAAAEQQGASVADGAAAARILGIG